MSENDPVARYNRPQGGVPPVAQPRVANVDPYFSGWATTILVLLAVGAIVVFIIVLAVVYPNKRDYNGVRFIPDNATECTLCPPNPPGRPGDKGETYVCFLF